MAQEVFGGSLPGAGPQGQEGELPLPRGSGWKPQASGPMPSSFLMAGHLASGSWGGAHT